MSALSVICEPHNRMELDSCTHLSTPLMDCPCGREEHTGLTGFISCLYCSSMTHPDCAKQYAWVSMRNDFQTFLTSVVDISLITGDERLIEDDKEGKPRQPVWTICPICSNQTTQFLPGQSCCAHFEDTSMEFPPSYCCHRPFEPIHIRPSCM